MKTTKNKKYKITKNKTKKYKITKNKITKNKITKKYKGGKLPNNFTKISFRNRPMNDNTCIDKLVGPKIKGGIMSVFGPNNYTACKRSIRGYNTLKLTKDEATEYKEFIKNYKKYFIDLYIKNQKKMMVLVLDPDGLVLDPDRLVLDPDGLVLDPDRLDPNLKVFPEDKHIENIGISYIINYIKSLIQTNNANNDRKLFEILENKILNNNINTINTTIYTLLINKIDNTNEGISKIYSWYNKPEIITPIEFKDLIYNYNNQIIPFESFETPDKIVELFKLIRKPIPEIINYGPFILKNIKTELIEEQLFNIIISSENILNKHSYFRLAIGNNNAELNFLELYKNTKKDTFLRNNRICIYNTNKIIYDTNNHIDPKIINIGSTENTFKNAILEFNYFLQILDQYLLNPSNITTFYEGKYKALSEEPKAVINPPAITEELTAEGEKKKRYNIFMKSVNTVNIFKINDDLDTITSTNDDITNYLNTNPPPPNKMLISLLNILNIPFLLSTNFLSINPLDIKPIGIFSDYTTTNILTPIEFTQVAITNFPNKDEIKYFINKHIPEYLILEPDLLSSKPIRIIKNKICKSINFLKLNIGTLVEEIGYVIQIVLIDFTNLENIILKTYSLILFKNMENIVENNFKENDSIYPIYTNFLKYVHDNLQKNKVDLDSIRGSSLSSLSSVL